MNCRQASQLASRSFEQQLPAEVRQALAEHAGRCPACARVERDFQAIRRACQELAERALEGDGQARLSTECRERLRLSLVQTHTPRSPA